MRKLCWQIRFVCYTSSSCEKFFLFSPEWKPINRKKSRVSFYSRARWAEHGTYEYNCTESRRTLIADGSSSLADTLPVFQPLSVSHSALTQTSSASAWIHPVTSISLRDRRRAVGTISLLAYFNIMWLLLTFFLRLCHLRCTAKNSVLHENKCFTILCATSICQCIHTTVFGEAIQPVTHSFPMVVFSSFVSFIVSGLCSLAAGVFRSTSTMAGSACGRIPLQRKVELYGHWQNVMQPQNKKSNLVMTLNNPPSLV